MEPEEQWRIVWSQGQALNNTERCLLFPNCSLIVPYKVNQGIRGECSSKMQQGASPAGEAQQAGVSHCSVNKLGACWEPSAPAETFIFLPAVTPPPLINACPGVFFTEAEAAFFILQDGSPNWWGVLEGIQSSRSKCLHSSFPHPIFSAGPTRPLGRSFLERCWDWLPPPSFVQHC